MIVNTTDIPDHPVPNPNWPLAPGDQTVAYFVSLARVAGNSQLGRQFNGVQSLIHAYTLGGLIGAYERALTGWKAAAKLGLEPFVAGWDIALEVLEGLIIDANLIPLT